MSNNPKSSDEQFHLPETDRPGAPLAAIPRILADRYTILEHVAHGSTAWVFRVWDRRDGSICALKLLKPSMSRRGSVARRLVAEGITMTLLAHPNICRVREVGTDTATGLAYIAMDWAGNGSAATRIREHGPLPVDEAASLLVQVLCALSLAHARGIVHRDVKPANVLLMEDGRATLADFGVARLPDIDGDTGYGTMLGSFAFMAPEQRNQPARVGNTADIYAAGATLFNLLTHRSPLDLFATTPTDPRFAVLSVGMRPVVRRATARAPVHRYPDARSMALDLRPMAPSALWQQQPHLRDWLED